jgi:hypothetical protein
MMTASFLILFISCQQKQTERFRTASKEIDLIKKGLTNYENAEWDAWAEQYADSAKIFQNSWSEFETPDQVRDRYKRLIVQLSDYTFDKDDLFMEQVIDDNGRTWVNFWCLWRGTLRVNQKVIEIPVHITFQFVNGKIKREYGYWDTAQLYEELNKLE